MRKLARRTWWSIAVAVAAAILVIILGLIATGVLKLPAAGPAAPVKIQEVCVNIQQGNNSSGDPWFGPSDFCMTGIPNGLPLSAAAGSAVNIPIPILNYDQVSHTLYAVQVAPPFTFQRSLPPLPYVVTSYTSNPEGIDGGLMVYIVLPNDPGLSAGVNITVNAIGFPT